MHFIHRMLSRLEKKAAARSIKKEPATPARKALRHGMAKVEYLACEEEIFQLITKGYSARLIHDHLIENGKIRMSYITLCQFIREAKLQKDKPAAPNTFQSGNINPSTLF